MPSSRPNRHHATQLAGLVATFCVLLNAAFYFLSDLYFADRSTRFGAGELASIGGVRLAFAMFTASVGGGTVAAAFAPRIVGHGLAIVACVMSFVGSYFAFARGLPGVLGTTMLLLGVVFPVLVWRSLARARAAWSFLIALCAVYAVVLVFGAPKVRGLLGVGLWHALIIPGMLAVAAVALLMLRGDYGELVVPAAPAPAPAASVPPAHRDRQRKAGIGTMVIGLAVVVVGLILLALPLGMGMAGTFVDFGLVLAGIIAIVRGYLHIPRP